MPSVGKNLRYILWRAEIPRNAWIPRLAAALADGAKRAGELLRDSGDALTTTESSILSKHFGVAGRSLQGKDLLSVEGTNILSENIRYLLDSLPRGEKKELASTLGVDATTVSRWRSGASRPTRKKQADFAHYFGIPGYLDLETNPLFLSLEPVTTQESRMWLHERIDGLEGSTLSEIFPALKRLLVD